MTQRYALLVLLSCLLASRAAADDEAPARPPPPAVPVKAARIVGRPQQNLVKVTNARYYVWHDSKGWHLRTASKGLVKFTGSIKLAESSFGKLRPIGLEVKGKNPDRWGVNDGRTEIRFEIRTGGSFDGFDFDIKEANRAGKIAFDLKIGQKNIRRPKRIFLGRDSQSPQGAHFACPANPEVTSK